MFEETILTYSHCSSVVPELQHRLRLDRRRFEAAHLKYAILTTQSRYPEIAAGSIAMNTDISSTLEVITPTFYDAFTQRYAGTYLPSSPDLLWEGLVSTVSILCAKFIVYFSVRQSYRILSNS